MLTVIMPVYNEGKGIYKNVNCVSKILKEAEIDHGFLLVDDGSKDNSWEEMVRLTKDMEHVKILRLSRNFGKEAALCAGLENADSDAVVVMDADLQHPPTLIPKMYSLWKNEGFDIVDGVKSSRGKESIFKKFAVGVYYKIFSKITGIKSQQLSDFKLMDIKVVKAWRKLRENNTYFRGMSAWVGYNHCSISFEVEPRKEGESKWSLKSLIKLSVNSIIAYTAAPLYLVLVFGIIMGIGAVVLTVQTLYMYFSHQAQTGFSTVILLQLFIGSAVMIGLSIIGLYIGKIYEEVKARPRFLIMEEKESLKDNKSN